VAGLVVDPRIMLETQHLTAIGDAFDRRAALRLDLEQTIPGVKRGVLGICRDFWNEK